jgi:hypothetical protein
MALISSIEVSFDTSRFKTTNDPLGQEHESIILFEAAALHDGIFLLRICRPNFDHLYTVYRL